MRKPDRLLQNHHSIVKGDPYPYNWMERLEVPASAVDDMPGMLLSRVNHVGNSSIPDAQRFHRVFREVVHEFEANPLRDLRNKTDIFSLHQEVYNRWGHGMGWGNDFGDKVRAVQEAWLRSRGYYP